MGLNGYLFPIPKNEMKASMIVHLVHLNKCHRFEPARFSLPSVEDLAFVIQAHSMGLPNLSLGTPCLGHLDDPFLREIDNLRLLADPGLSLLACHIDLTNAFWSLILPEPYKNSFRVPSTVDLTPFHAFLLVGVGPLRLQGHCPPQPRRHSACTSSVCRRLANSVLPRRFRKRFVRLGGHYSRTSVLRHRIPSLAGQGSLVICTPSNLSGGDVYRCAILMLCHLPHHRRCLHGNHNQRRYVALARLQECHLASPLPVPCKSLAIPISRSAARPNAGASPGEIRRSHEAQACAYGSSRRVIWQWSRLLPWYVIPTLEMLDCRSDEIFPTLHRVAKDRARRCVYLPLPHPGARPSHKLEEVGPPEPSLSRGIHRRLRKPP